MHIHVSDLEHLVIYLRNIMICCLSLQEVDRCKGSISCIMSSMYRILWGLKRLPVLFAQHPPLLLQQPAAACFAPPFFVAMESHQG